MRDESAAMNHPETGLLAAFANRALTAPERASLLIHLGGCARCRDVVFLAQRSVLPAEQEESFISGLWQKRSNFRLATAGLAACLLVVCAIAGGAIVWMHRLGNGSRGAETAALRPLPSPSPALASPPAITRPPERTHRKPQLPVPAKIVPGAPSMPSVWVDSSAGISMPQTSVRELDEEPIQQAKPVSPKQLEAQRKMWLRERAAVQALAQQAEHVNNSKPAAGDGSSKPPVADLQPLSSIEQAKGSSASPDSASQNTTTVVTLQPQTPAAEPEPHLPSGLAVASRIEIEGRILALDTAGALFASDDRGRHWRRMKTPWVGGAYELVGFPPRVSAAASGAGAPDSSSAQSGGYPDYRVVMAFCASGERWMSLDRGKTWRPALPEHNR